MPSDVADVNKKLESHRMILDTVVQLSTQGLRIEHQVDDVPAANSIPALTMTHRQPQRCQALTI